MDYMREIEPIENTMQGNRELSSLKPIDKIGNLKSKNVHSTIRTETAMSNPRLPVDTSNRLVDLLHDTICALGDWCPAFKL